VKHETGRDGYHEVKLAASSNVIQERWLRDDGGTHHTNASRVCVRRTLGSFQRRIDQRQSFTGRCPAHNATDESKTSAQQAKCTAWPRPPQQVVGRRFCSANQFVTAIRVPVKTLQEQGTIRVAVAQSLQRLRDPPPHRVQVVLHHFRLEHRNRGPVFITTRNAEERIRLSEGVLHARTHPPQNPSKHEYPSSGHDCVPCCLAFHQRVGTRTFRWRS
jgi:hypothetical protein